jgi:small-conductance mechanosensitive channel
MDDGGFKRLLVLSYLAVFFIVRSVWLVSKLLLAPKNPTLRLVPIEDATASYLYSWTIRISMAAGVGLLACVFMELERAEEALFILTGSLTGLIIVAMFIYVIWRNRERVSTRIRRELAGCSIESQAFRARIAGLWHYFAIPYLLALWVLWVLYLLIGQIDVLVPVLALLLSIPVFMLVNGILQKLLDSAFCFAEIQAGAPPVDSSGESQNRENPPADAGRETLKGRWDINRYVDVIRRLLSFSIGSAVFFWLLRIWGLDVEIGRRVTAAAFQISIGIIISFIIWKAIEAAIHRRLAEIQQFDAGEDDEREAGGEGGSRLGTILYLVRKFVLVGLSCVVILIVLSATGVDITPLLAGAGVVGLAIGFGSQTLVKDIVSGIFYLVDDAFRIGDYVDSGKLQGTVEHISIRSMKLRHARGMVHTIPFSELGAVTNYSRDYIIEKLNVRVPFDADLRKIKKIIKKINDEISQDEELGAKLLGPIKSQGVKELQDSAIVMRIKFKTKPGEQFIIKREVFDRLQKAFEKAGIEFAHRHVIVRLPHEPALQNAPSQETAQDATEQSAAPPLLTAGASAAIAAVLAEEELLKQKEEAEKKS